jgi:hypothetical protein
LSEIDSPEEDCEKTTNKNLLDRLLEKVSGAKAKKPEKKLGPQKARVRRNSME